jgi:hypothetical protein
MKNDILIPDAAGSKGREPYEPGDPMGTLSLARLEPESEQESNAMK